jgi:hypothetical protein
MSTDGSSSGSGPPSASGVAPSTSGTASSGASGADISAVSVNLKLPPFWPADPELWFAQVEAQFACRRITSQKSKFDHVVGSLSPEFAVEVRDLLLKPPTDSPYTALKEQLTKRTTASEQRKLQQLFTGEELGDRKPTQLLRRMQQLLGDRPGLVDGSFLQELFLQRLPPSVRMVLASTPSATTLENLAEMADKIMEVATPASASTGPALTVAAATVPPNLSTEVEHLRADVARLEKLIRKMGRARSSSRPSTHQSRHSPTPTPPTPTDTLCWYHKKFGDQARGCRPPCSWPTNEQAGH